MKLARMLKPVSGSPLGARLAVIALICLLASPLALAQRDKDEPMYPNATREEPDDAQATQRNAKKLNRLYDLYQDEKYDESTEVAMEVIEGRSNAYEKGIAWQSIGYNYLGQDNYPKAIEALQKAIETDGLPNNVHFQLMYQVAQMQLQEENYDAALQTIDRFLEQTRSQDPDHLVLKGNALYRMERYDEAIPVLRQAIDSSDEPEDSWLQLLMAVYFEKDTPLEAASIAEDLLAKNPNDKTLVRNLSSIYLQAEQNEKAAQVLEDAKARGVLTTAEDYEQLYKLYYYVEQEEKAIATINEGLEKGILEPSAELYRTLGEANYFSQNYDAAIDAYRKGAELAETGELNLQLSRILQEEERFAEAKEAAQAALNKGVERPGDAYLILGAAEFGLDNRAGAVAAYKQAAKYPESKTVAETWLRQSGMM